MANRPNYKKRAQRAFEEDFLAQTIEDEEFIISVTSKAHVTALRYITRQIEECINDRKTQERLKQTVSEAVQSALRTFVSEELREVRVRAVERIETAAENMIKNIKARAAREDDELLILQKRLDMLEGTVGRLSADNRTLSPTVAGRIRLTYGRITGAVAHPALSASVVTAICFRHAKRPGTVV